MTNVTLKHPAVSNLSAGKAPRSKALYSAQPEGKYFALFKACRPLFVLALAFLLSGCTMAPVYKRPEPPIAASWPGYAEMNNPVAVAESNGAVMAKPADPADLWRAEAIPSKTQNSLTAQAEPEQAALPDWKAFFSDQTLQALLDLAITNNRDLRVAILNVERARGMYQIQRSELLPSIMASGANSSERIPEDLSTLGREYIARESSVTVGFTSYELDLFGRVRSLKEAALQDYFATEANAQSAKITLMAEVANAYFLLAADREEMTLAEETYASNKETYDTAVKMEASGLASQLDVSQARASMEDARYNAAQFRATALQDENALTLLLGAPIPTELILAKKLDEITPLRDIPAGLPSSLLARRPDILAAEYSLKGANANIGAARANFFPRIGLTANIGTASTDLYKLFSSGTGTWLFAPSITLPLFEAGRNIANLNVAEADRDIAVANYERSIQTAFREVADTLAQRSTINEQLDAEAALLQATTTSYNLSKLRFEIGLDDFFAVLAAQRGMFVANQSYIFTRLLREVNILTMYKTLGGGWQ